MGKRIKPTRNEAGFALVWVLVLLLVAGLILAPFLILMTTGIRSAHFHEDVMLAFYAADAGIEDAVYKILNQDANLPPTADDPPYQYTIADVNGNQVTVAIENIWILEGFGDIESEHPGSEPHNEVLIVGHTAEAGTYQIGIVYDGSIANVWLLRIGVWLPSGFSYVGGTSAAVTTLSAPIDDTVDVIPVTSTALFPSQGILYVDNEQIEYTDTEDTAFTGCTRGAGDTIAAPHSSGVRVSGALTTAVLTESPYRDGTAYMWDFDPTVNLNSGAGPPFLHSMSFQFTPADEEPTGAFAWVRVKRHDVYICWDLAYGIFRATATAGETTVISYIIGPDPFDILTYTYDSQ